MLVGTGGSVLFVMPPGGVTPWFPEHLGTAFLRTMLARAGIPSLQYLPERNPSLGGFAGFLETLRPALVGFTVYESNLPACRALARVARERLPEAVVAVGGPSATFSPEETLELVPADLCLRGAGEGTIVAVAEAILGSEDPRGRLPDRLAAIPNLVLRSKDALVRTRAGDLSSFPAQHFRCIDDIPSPYQAGIVASADVGLLTSRGCNQACTYCSFATISGRRVHHHGVERVLEDLAALKALEARVERRRKHVSINDDAFTLAPQRARDICEGILARGLQMPFVCETRADRVDGDLLRLMKAAGFVEVSFGLESAVPHVLRAIGKVQDPGTSDDPAFDRERAWLERFRRSVAAARDAGLSVSVSIIGGLPTETAGDLRSTLAFVESLAVTRYAHNVLTLYPGTPLHRDAARHGLAAGRDRRTGSWWTRLAYDAAAVPHGRRSMTRLARWSEAREVSDALCGNARSSRAADEAAWAVVLHREAPDPEVATWLRDVLAVQGAVVVVNARRSCTAAEGTAWAEALHAAAVPHGPLVLLSREGGPAEPLALRSLGTLGTHRFEIDPTWSPRAGVEADAAGHCGVAIWLASHAEAVPPSSAPEDSLLAATPQIADGCRWWSAWRRCRRPAVLHVWPDSTVTPCWHGPSIGRVGDAYRDLAARGEALGAGPASFRDRCPIARRDEAPRIASAVEEYEIAAAVPWLVGPTEPAR